MRTSNSIELELKGKNIADKTIKASSSNSGIEVAYNNQKLVITNKQNDGIKSIIKVWEADSPNDTMEFAVTILPKLILVTKMNSEYGWYLDDEKIEEIMTKNYNNAKNDKFEIVS